MSDALGEVFYVRANTDVLSSSAVIGYVALPAFGFLLMTLHPGAIPTRSRALWIVPATLWGSSTRALRHRTRTPRVVQQTRRSWLRLVLLSSHRKSGHQMALAAVKAP